MSDDPVPCPKCGEACYSHRFRDGEVWCLKCGIVVDAKRPRAADQHANCRVEIERLRGLLWRAADDVRRRFPAAGKVVTAEQILSVELLNDIEDELKEDRR